MIMKMVMKVNINIKCSGFHTIGHLYRSRLHCVLLPKVSDMPNFYAFYPLELLAPHHFSYFKSVSRAFPKNPSLSYPPFSLLASIYLSNCIHGPLYSQYYSFSVVSPKALPFQKNFSILQSTRQISQNCYSEE